MRNRSLPSAAEESRAGQTREPRTEMTERARRRATPPTTIGAIATPATASDAAEKSTAPASETDAPRPRSAPNTVIERKPPEERLDFDKISDDDAMGKDKRREVVGGTYGPTRARVFGTFAAFFALVAALTVGFYFLAKELDQPPAENPDVAPWSQAEAPQTPPKPLQ